MDLWSLFYHLSLLVLLKSKSTLILASLWNISAFTPIFLYEPMVFQSVSKLVEWSMKRALHVFLFIYFIIPIFGTLFLPFPLLLEVQMSLQWMIFWHHLRLFLEDEIPNGDFSTDGEHGQYAVGIDIVRLPNQGRREWDLFLTGHDVAPLDCYAGNNRVQMKKAILMSFPFWPYVEGGTLPSLMVESFLFKSW